MSMDVIGDAGDPKKDAAALQPELDEMELKAIDALVERVVPALQSALTNALAGLTITITISKKEQS